ncbi:MAG: Hsp20/alpha crystallin family protein [Bacteroidota bacterium]
MKTHIQPFHSLSRLLHDSADVAFTNQYLVSDRDLLNTQWHEEANSFMANVPVPGMSKDDLSIHMEGRVLVISTKRHTKSNESIKNLSRGSFKYSIILPDGIDTDRIQAKCRHGLLTITVEKKEKTRKHTVVKVLGPESGPRETERLETFWDKIKGKMNVGRLSTALPTGKSS